MKLTGFDAIAYAEREGLLLNKAADHMKQFLGAHPEVPQADKLTYTQQSSEGPTNVVEGYFHGDVKEAHDEFKKELEGAGFKILFDELEEHDSEVSWQGEGRTGQVALREECGENDKTYVRITNRPA